MKKIINEIEKYFEIYKRDGVVKIPSVFNAQRIKELRAGFYEGLINSHKISKYYKYNNIEYSYSDGIKYPALLFWPCFVSPIIDSFSKSQEMQFIVSKFLSRNVKQLNNQCYFRLPGDMDEFAFHQDIMFRYPLDQYPSIVEDDGYLQTAIFVDKQTIENSPIIFALGSHKLGDVKLHSVDNLEKFRKFKQEKYLSDRFKLKTFSINPGDMLLWSSLTIHGSKKNKSESSRMYLMNGFARSKNCHPYPDYMINGKLVEIDSSRII